MNLDEETIRNRCTNAVFERGRDYRDDGRVRRIDRFDDVVTAEVRGSNWYDVTLEPGAKGIDAGCTCPYDGPGECKHVVAVLLDIAADCPRDESERVEAAIQDVPAADLRTFVRDALAGSPELREKFLAQFGDATRPFDEYDDVERLFDRHARDHPVVVDAIDFSHVFDLAERYRERDCHRAAATVYRAVFAGIDDNANRIDAAYDHYLETLQSALDGYVECVLAADPNDFESWAGVLDERASTDTSGYREQFERALNELENRR